MTILDMCMYFESGNTGYVQCKHFYVFLFQIYEFQHVLNVLLNTRSLNQLHLKTIRQHPFCNVINTSRNLLLQLQGIRWRWVAADLCVVSIQMMNEISPSMSPSRSAVYNRNRIGPKTEPCGTPHNKVAGVELEEPQRTNCIRPLR